MREGHKTRFVGRRRQIHAIFEHRREKPSEGDCITLLRLCKGIDGALMKEETKHPTDTTRRHRHAQLPRYLCEPGREGVRPDAQGLVDAIGLEKIESRKARSGRKRIS